jgi:hypothetical protein
MERDNLEPPLLDATDNFADEPAFDTIGFYEHERFLFLRVFHTLYPALTSDDLQM